MNTLLPQKIRSDLEHHGVVYPIDVLEGEHATALLADYERIAQRMTGWTGTRQVVKVHVVSKIIWDVICNPNIVDAVQAKIGPDVLCWGATFFAKPPASGGYVGWHQDLTYWGLEPAEDVVTAWIAFTDAHLDNGCMSVIGASHKNDFRAHINRTGTDNLLLSGQEVELTDEERANMIHCELEPGQASIHHSMALHGSNPNLSTRSRIGLSVQYISARVTQKNNGGTDSAMRVAGDTSSSSMIHTPPPDGEFTPQGIQNWKDTVAHPSGLGSTADDVSISARLEEIS